MAAEQKRRQDSTKQYRPMQDESINSMHFKIVNNEKREERKQGEGGILSKGLAVTIRLIFPYNLGFSREF